MQLTPSDLKRLSGIIARRSGMAFTESRWPFLQNTARGVMARGGFTDGSRWTEELEASPEAAGGLYSELEEALQIHETSFFRYERYHSMLGEIVIPELARDRMPQWEPRIRIWSVGCSTGEEPYSIAMTVRESLPHAAAGAVEIVATDLSREALAAAQRGFYTSAGVRPVPGAYLAKYFVRRPEGFSVAQALREMVQFFHYDIRRGLYIGKFDVVVCCNVLLYFTDAVKRQVVGRLAASLRRGGYLFLGHAEGIAPPAEQFDSRRLPGGFVYRRI